MAEGDILSEDISKREKATRNIKDLQPHSGQNMYINRNTSILGIDQNLPTEEGRRVLNKLTPEIEHAFRTISTASSIKDPQAAINGLTSLLNNETAIDLASTMLDNPSQYKFELGILLSQIKLTDIPEKTREKMKPLLTDLELGIKLEHGNWHLCGQAESKLQKSLNDQAVIMVNDKFLMKFDGKLTGLCLTTFTTANGQTFIEGNWYSPTDKASREAIKQAFDDGITRATAQGGEWLLMRPLASYEEESPDEMLEKARRSAANLPDKLPDQIDGKTRKEYRQTRRE